MSRARLFGGILLIAGTTIGGGILALPVTLAEAGFIPSALLLTGCWLAMTTTAMLLLEVTLWFPRNSHLISMAGKTLGPIGVIFTWTAYLLLLYTLNSAYISGGTDLLQNFLSVIHINTSLHFSSILFTLLLGSVILGGIRSVDLVNRGLMFVKLGAFLLLTILLLQHAHLTWLEQTGKLHSGGILVALVSFGFSVIIPSIRNYFNDNVKHLKIAILVGSGIPLIAYLLWIAAVMGVIPRTGDDGLISMLHAGRPVSGMVEQISLLLQQPLVTGLARIFTSVCLLTSFLGVGLCLADFLADGFKVVKQGAANFWVCVGSLLPPLLIVLFRPDIFVLFIGWSGVLVVLLTILLPIAMIWRGRYKLHLAKSGSYRVFGGKILLILLLMLSIFVTISGILDLIKN